MHAPVTTTVHRTVSPDLRLLPPPYPCRRTQTLACRACGGRGRGGPDRSPSLGGSRPEPHSRGPDAPLWPVLRIPYDDKNSFRQGSPCVPACARRRTIGDPAQVNAPVSAAVRADPAVRRPRCEEFRRPGRDALTLAARRFHYTYSRTAGATCWRRLPASNPKTLADVGIPFPYTRAKIKALSPAPTAIGR
jgi:hypothetical protein